MLFVNLFKSFIGLLFIKIAYWEGQLSLKMKKTHTDELDDISQDKLGKAILVYIAGSNSDLGYITILYAIVKILVFSFKDKKLQIDIRN